MKTWETFHPPSDRDSYGSPRMMDVRRYRVTVEVIDEPLEVLQQRAMAVIAKEYGNHHVDSAREAWARTLGIVIDYGPWSHRGPPCIPRLATDADRAEWARKDEEAAKWAKQRAEREAVKKAAITAKRKAAREAKKAKATNATP